MGEVTGRVPATTEHDTTRREAAALAVSRERMGLAPYTTEQWAAWYARWGQEVVR